ncbi:MAG: hypothetical protein V3V18_13895 [Methylococcales bacterium]
MIVWKMALSFASIHQRILALLVWVTSKWVSIRGVLKIPIFFLTIPLGLLLTIIGMLGFIFLVITLSPFYTIQSVLRRFSNKERIQYLKERYQRRQQKFIAHEQSKRLKISLHSDKADMQYLVKLTYNEINNRKKNIDHIIVIETKRRLKRCLDEMNFDDALRIHSTIVNTELDLLNESLNQLFK